MKKLLIVFMSIITMTFFTACGDLDSSREQKAEPKTAASESENPAEDAIPNDDNALNEAETENTDASVSQTVLGSSDFTDLDNNKISPDEICAKYNLTMINCFATWCGPCKEEMPELAKIYDKSDFEKFNLIGVAIDCADSNGNLIKNAVADAKTLKKDSNVNFDFLAPSTEFIEGTASKIIGVPTTFFVDKSGKAVGEPVVGSKTYDEWKNIIEERFDMIKEN